MQGLPDWGRPAAGGHGFAAFEVEGVVLVLPDTLALAVEPDGTPSFHLSAYRPLVPTPDRRGYGRLDLALRVASGAATADGAVRAAAPLRGVLRLSADALSLPPELAAPVELDCTGLGMARLMLPLEAQGVTFVEQALESGAAPVLAAVDVEVAGVAARMPGHVSVDLARLRMALVGDGLTLAALVEALALDAAKLGVTVTGASFDVPPRLLAEAVADRIRANLCAGPLRTRADAGLTLVLADTGIAGGSAALDLGTPVVASRVLTLALDPFAAARAIGDPAALTTRSTSGQLQSGQHEIVVDVSLARPCTGPLSFGARLVCPPRPPARTHEVREDFELPEDGGSIARTIRLAPNEPLAWTLTGYAFWPTADGRGVERLEGTAQAGDGTRALLRPQDFPLRFVEVEAGAALLALATVEIGFGSARAVLNTATPRMTLAVRLEAPAPQVTATLRGTAGAQIVLPPRDAAGWRIELADVPSYGPRQLDISVVLPPGVTLKAIEVLPEDAAPDDAPEVYAFTAATPARTHRWLCRDPFRPGLRWRWRGDASFSAPVTGGRLDLTPEVAAA